MPKNSPAVGDSCRLAFRVIGPSTVVRLDPVANVMPLAVVIKIVPDPEVARLLAAFGRLIVLDAKAIRVLSAANVTAPLNVTVLNSLPGAPMNRLEVRSGRALTAIVSDALPRLICTEPVGLAKSVVSNVPALLKRDIPLLVVPSSASVAAFGPAGRLKMTSVAVPKFDITMLPLFAFV